MLKANEFKNDIKDYYISSQLVESLLKIGEIPKDTVETFVGVGFVDIEDYTFISKFLSPKENQILLNGLYAAFRTVLRQYGGFLSKHEGDSIMFHFGGLLDQNTKKMNHEDTINYIARSLFYTSVMLQRVCVLFNNADESLIDEQKDNGSKGIIEESFSIINSMRKDEIISEAFNAFFQIRIRIGASIGEVSIGNFGPPGEKHLDLIGLTIIKAKRMESTAPAGGLRISEEFYNILEESGAVDEYYEEFKEEAKDVGGFFQDILKEDLFNKSNVIIKDKRNAEFTTYSVQVNPLLPEAIAVQIELLLYKEESGVNMIISFIKYYRGNKFVIRAIEKLFKVRGINVRKAKLFEIIFPKKFKKIKDKYPDEEKLKEHIEKNYSLYDIFKYFGELQDNIKKSYTPEYSNNESFISFEIYLEKEKDKIEKDYQKITKSVLNKNYFYNYLYPQVFACIKASIIEYQTENIDIIKLI